MTNRAVVLTGQIRNESGFVEFLDFFDSHYADSRPLLYFSTWKGELDKYKAAGKKLNELRAKIFVQEQPDLFLPGHTLHQIVALDTVLNYIEPDMYVFKSRPDASNINFYKIFMASTPEPTINRLIDSVAPKYKISVSGFNLAHPFYINDMTYSGMSSDLKLLVRLPFVLMTRYQRMAAEQLIWGGAPIAVCRIFDNYFRVNAGLIRDKDKTLLNAKMLKECSAYHFALGAYLLILSSWFSTFDRSEVASNVIANTNLDDLLWGDLRAPAFHYHPFYFVNWVNNINVVNQILSGNYSRTEFGESVLNSLEILRDVERPQDYFSDEIKLSTYLYSENLSKINIVGDRLYRSDENTVVINAASAAWNLERPGNPLIEKLESEVNFLRRANDSLRDQMLKRG